MFTSTSNKPLFKTASETMSYYAYAGVSYEDATDAVVGNFSTAEMKSVQKEMKQNNESLQSLQKEQKEAVEFLESHGSKREGGNDNELYIKKGLFHHAGSLLLMIISALAVEALAQNWWISGLFGITSVMLTRGLVSHYFSRWQRTREQKSWKRVLSIGSEIIVLFVAASLFFVSFLIEQSLTETSIWLHVGMMLSVLMLTTLWSVKIELSDFENTWGAWIEQWRTLRYNRTIQKRCQKYELRLPEIRAELKYLENAKDRLETELNEATKRFAKSLLAAYQDGEQFKRLVESHPDRQKIEDQINIDINKFEKEGVLS